MIFLILLAAFGAVILCASAAQWQAKKIQDSPWLYPMLASGGMLLCSSVAIVKLARRRSDEDDSEAEGSSPSPAFISALGIEVPLTVFVMMAATILYIASISLAGFYPSTFVYLVFSIIFLFDGRREYWLKAVLTSVGTLAVIFCVIEKLFQIRLP